MRGGEEKKENEKETQGFMDEEINQQSFRDLRGLVNEV